MHMLHLPVFGYVEINHFSSVSGSTVYALGCLCMNMWHALSNFISFIMMQRIVVASSQATLSFHHLNNVFV